MFKGKFLPVKSYLIEFQTSHWVSKVDLDETLPTARFHSEATAQISIEPPRFRGTPLCFNCFCSYQKLSSI